MSTGTDFELENGSFQNTLINAELTADVQVASWLLHQEIITDVMSMVTRQLSLFDLNVT